MLTDRILPNFFECRQKIGASGIDFLGRLVQLVMKRCEGAGFPVFADLGQARGYGYSSVVWAGRELGCPSSFGFDRSTLF